MDFEETWRRIKEKTDIKTQQGLANKLNMTQGSVSDAKKRGEFPTGWAFKIAQIYGLSTDWLLTGKMLSGEGNEDSLKDETEIEILKDKLIEALTENSSLKDRIIELEKKNP